MKNNDVINNSNIPEKTLERISGGNVVEGNELIYQDTVKTHHRPVIIGATKNQGGGNEDYDSEP